MNPVQFLNSFSHTIQLLPPSSISTTTENIARSLNASVLSHYAVDPFKHFMTNNWHMLLENRHNPGKSVHDYVLASQRARNLIGSIRLFAKKPDGKPIVVIERKFGQIETKEIEYWGSDTILILDTYPDIPVEGSLLLLYRYPASFISSYSIDDNVGGVCFSTVDLANFLYLICRNEAFADFLRCDQTFETSDKYLIAISFLYLRGANFTSDITTNLLALGAFSLANQVCEESNKSLSSTSILYAFQKSLESTYSFQNVLELINKIKEYEFVIAQKLNFRLFVPKTACQQVFGVFPLHPIWQRVRNNYSETSGQH